MRRALPVIVISLLVNFFLFFMMTRMLTGEKLKPKETLDAQSIELIDLKLQDKAPKKIKKTKRLTLPKTPPPLKTKTLPPLRPKPPPPKPKPKPPPPKPPPEKIRIEPPPPVPIPDPVPVVIPPEPEPIPEETVEAKPPAVEEIPVVEEVQIVEEIPVVKEIQPLEALPPAPVEVTAPDVPEPAPSVIETPSETVASKEVQANVIEVDVVPLLRVQPRYPRRAIRAKLEGMVTIEFTILTDGSVSNPVIVASAPPKVFDRAALSAIQKWKFSPKQVQGKTVSRRAIQNIRFSLNSRKK